MSDKQGTEAFFAYARKRHQIYLDRTAGKPRPWTKDEILNTYKFTNVFRELDKTTAWFAKYAREPMRDKPKVLLATVVFRLLNRIEVGEAIFNQLDIEGGSAFDLFARTGKVAHLKKAIVANCGSGPYVTGAYIISSPPTYSKLDGVLKVIDKFTKRSHWRQIAEDMRKDKWSLEDAWEWLKVFDYFGPFHSYEMVTDLRHTALLGNASDIMMWANPGPGAHRGANRVFRGDKDVKVHRDVVIDEMRILLSLSRDPKLWPQNNGVLGIRGSTNPLWPTWEMRDVEHTLCEFDKYERVRLGEGRPRGVYR